MNNPGLKIGVLALQGGYSEHVVMLEKLSVQPALVRSSNQIESLDGLIIPGGESTALTRLLGSQPDLKIAILNAAKIGVVIWGTCAGAILLSASGEDGRVPVTRLGLIDVRVDRNAYGRQAESFIEEIACPDIEGGAFPAVFIRAPKFGQYSQACQIIASRPDGEVVGLQQDNIMITSFHPELTQDTRIHAYFLQCVEGDQHATSV